LTDLGSKVLSVVVVIMGTTFLEHFIQWKKPLETLQFGTALTLVIADFGLFPMVQPPRQGTPEGVRPEYASRMR
jgi:uncharacterized membrane protein YqhA